MPLHLIKTSPLGCKIKRRINNPEAAAGATALAAGAPLGEAQVGDEVSVGRSRQTRSLSRSIMDQQDAAAAIRDRSRGRTRSPTPYRGTRPLDIVDREALPEQVGEIRDVEPEYHQIKLRLKNFTVTEALSGYVKQLEMVGLLLGPTPYKGERSEHQLLDLREAYSQLTTSMGSIWKDAQDWRPEN